MQTGAITRQSVATSFYCRADLALLVTRLNLFGVIKMSECKQKWVANSGKGGEPQFTLNKQMGSIPSMHVKCDCCGCRTWISKATWIASQRPKAH